MVAMKLFNELLVDDKITACVRQICLLDVICKVSKRKTLSGETFCIEKRLLSILILILSLHPLLKNGTPFTYLVHSYASFLKAVNALSLQYEKITKPEPFSWLFLSHLYYKWAKWILIVINVSLKCPQNLSPKNATEILFLFYQWVLKTNFLGQVDVRLLDPSTIQNRGRANSNVWN